ncbi:MAG: transposase, partial [Opitutaceae bacterium]|nr:transposase [Opitutaceae bacterium]
MSRTVNGEQLFDDVAKEVLRKQLWQVADYTGVEIITYAILSN